MGFFDFFSGSKKDTSRLQNLAALEVDIHSHLIPGIDDGAQSMQDSIHLIRLLQNIGFKKIITSPHIMTGGYNNTPAIINEGKENVIAELKRQNITIEFDAYAEYYIDDTINDKLQEELIFVGNKLILAELSYFTKPFNYLQLFFNLNKAGYQVILAHPERYPYFHQSDLEEYKQIKDMGILLQGNITSFSGAYGQGAKNIVEKLVKENMIDLLGTDLHNEKHFNLILQSMKSKTLENVLLSDRLLNKKLFR